MDNIELGQDVNALAFNNEKNEFEAVTGKVSGLFVDPHGRQFVQIKKRKGAAVNVDRYTVNATSEERQNYMDVINNVREIEKSGNIEIETTRETIVEACNEHINDLYATLTPMIDLSFDDEDTQEAGDELPSLEVVADEAAPVHYEDAPEAVEEDDGHTNTAA